MKILWKLLWNIKVDGSIKLEGFYKAKNMKKFVANFKNLKFQKYNFKKL